MPSIKHKKNLLSHIFFILNKALIFYNHQEKFYFQHYGRRKHEAKNCCTHPVSWDSQDKDHDLTEYAINFSFYLSRYDGWHLYTIK